MSVEVCCRRNGLFAEKYKAKINANIFCFKKCVFFMVYLS